MIPFFSPFAFVTFPALFGFRQQFARADRWPDTLPIKSLEPRMVCTRCGTIGADVRPDFRPASPKVR